MTFILIVFVPPESISLQDQCPSELQTAAVKLLLLEPRQQMREMLLMWTLPELIHFLSVYFLWMCLVVCLSNADFVHLEARKVVKD